MSASVSESSSFNVLRLSAARDNNAEVGGDTSSEKGMMCCLKYAISTSPWQCSFGLQSGKQAFNFSFNVESLSRYCWYQSMAS